MTIQPCPDCGTIMNDCYDPLDTNSDQCWHCPNCGNTWTRDEIDIEYALNAAMDENYPSPDEGIRE